MALPSIILAAGGTGGHIFPAEALGEEIRARGYHPILMTDARFKTYGGAFGGMDVRTIAAGQFSGHALKKLGGLLRLVQGIWQARRMLKSLRPLAVVGFGGYPSFPTMIAAHLLGIPTLIHEQNAVLGRANRVLANRVNAVAASYPSLGNLPESCQDKMTVTGNPVRAGILALRERPYVPSRDSDAFQLLVLGGSQGASVFSAIVPQACALLPEPLRCRLRVVQQCRTQEIEQAKEAYAAMGVNAELANFFTDMPARLSATHLGISRAGASSIAELAVAGIPSVLVPLPSAMDDHQTANARALTERGGAWLLPQRELTPARLAEKLAEWMASPEQLAKAAENAKQTGRLDAAGALFDLTLKIASTVPKAP